MRFLQGRTNRRTYWASIGVVAVLLVVISLIDPAYAKINEVVAIVVCVPRLHDIGRSGWWVMGPIGLELVTVISMFTGAPTDRALILAGVIVMLSAGLMIWLGAIPGQPGENRFGPAPVGFRMGRRPAANSPPDHAL